MKKIKISVTTEKTQGALIKDNRDNRYYFEKEAGMIRMFETLLSEDISINDAIIKVAEDAGVSCVDIQLIY